MTTYTDAPTFPDYEYTFEVEQFLFDQGTMLVNYKPKNKNLMSVKYNIPIWPGMDVNNMKPYLDNWAPKEKWFAQEKILELNNITIKG